VKPADFAYHAARTTAGAISMLEEFKEEGRVLAGGQSLVPMMNFRLAQPAHLIDINPVSELDYIRVDGTSLAVGALSRGAAVEVSRDVSERAQLLLEAIGLVAHPTIRHRGTIGGSIAHADPVAELPTVALALDGQMVVANAREVRIVAAADFFKGPYITALEPGELLTECRFRIWPSARTGHAFLEFARTHASFAVVAVGVVLHLEGEEVAQAAIAICGLAGTPIRNREAEDLLIGKRPTPQLLEKAAATAIKGLQPASDIHGSSQFRLKVGRVYVYRALELALRRAGESKHG